MRFLLIAALTCATAAAAAAAPKPKKQPAEALDSSARIGAGSQRLVVTAVKIARKEWRPDACFAGFEGQYGGDEAGRQDSSKFFFYAPATGEKNFTVTFNGRGEARWEALGSSPPECIREMSVDSGDAIAIASKNGLEHGPSVRFYLYLVLVADTGLGWGWADSLHRDHPHTRGKTVWVVSAESRTLIIDAKTGKILGAVAS
jgi:hypothetical protein